MAGAVPELVGAAWQFLLVAVPLSGATITRACAPAFPRTAVLIPAWNEGAVIGASIDRLMALEYPRGRAARLRGRRCEHRRHARRWCKAKEAQYPGPRGPPAPG